MITVNIDENTLLDLLLDRVEYWTKNTDIMELYENYYRKLIDCGAFEGSNLDVNLIVDNDYINNLAVVSRDNLSDYDIDLEEDRNADKVEVYSENNGLYLVRAY